MKQDAASEADIILFLRESGVSKIQSIHALTRIFDIAVAESKEKIHYSEVWADRRGADEKFHEEIFEYVENTKEH